MAAIRPHIFIAALFSSGGIISALPHFAYGASDKKSFEETEEFNFIPLKAGAQRNSQYESLSFEEAGADIGQRKRPPRELRLSSDRQSFDSVKKQFVAEGRASAVIEGYLLNADRIEFDRNSNTLLAIGSVRFTKGNQYFQAGSLSYNFDTREGQLNDVYGVLDLSNFLEELRANSENSFVYIPKDYQGIACPLLSGRERLADIKKNRNNRYFPPPLGCPNSNTVFKERLFSLKKELGNLGMEKVNPVYRNYQDRIDSRDKQNEKKNIKTAAFHDLSRYRLAGKDSYAQRVSNISFRNSLAIQGQFGLPSSSRNAHEQNKFGGNTVSQLSRIAQKKFITGSVKRWRFQADTLKLGKDGWTADTISFTNDPLSPAQVRIETSDVIAREEENGDFLIKARSSRLIIEDRIALPMVKKRRFKTKDSVENRWVLGIDNKDRDGFFIGRTFEPIELGKKYALTLQPQFLIQRAINGKTNSYVGEGKSINSNNVSSSADWADLFGMRAYLKGQEYGWDMNVNADISTFNRSRIHDGGRYWADFTNTFEFPWVNQIDANVFAAFRYRVWNGSLGETDIYTAYGAYFEKKGSFNSGQLNSDYLWRVGGGNYQAESNSDDNLLTLWRANFYSSINSSYSLWTGKKSDKEIAYAYRYSAKPIVPGLSLNSNFRTSYFAYQDGSNQTTISLSAGPTLTLGTFTRPYFDYTKISLSIGGSIKNGVSPFKFDNAVDLATAAIGLTQQLIGPLLFKAGFEWNIDSSSEYFGKSINSKFELKWQRRAYEVALLYKPYDGIGGLIVKLNDFNIKGTGIPFVGYK